MTRHALAWAFSLSALGMQEWCNGKPIWWQLQDTKGCTESNNAQALKVCQQLPWHDMTRAHVMKLTEHHTRARLIAIRQLHAVMLCTGHEGQASGILWNLQLGPSASPSASLCKRVLGTISPEAAIMKNHVYHKVSEKQAVFHGIVCRTWAASAGPNRERLPPEKSLWTDNEQQYLSPSGHLNKEKSLFYLLVMTFSLQENWLAQAQSHQRTSCHRPTFDLSANGHVASSRWPIGKGTPAKQALREYHRL